MAVASNGVTMGNRFMDLSQAAVTSLIVVSTQAVAATDTFVLALQDIGLTPKDQVDLFSKILEQGGLFVVILVVLYFYRRDFRADKLNQQATVNALLHVVQANVTTMQEMKAAIAQQQLTHERLARAVEVANNRRRVTDHEP